MSGPVQRRHRQDLQKGREGPEEDRAAGARDRGGRRHWRRGARPASRHRGIGRLGSFAWRKPLGRGAQRRGDRRDHRRDRRLRHHRGASRARSRARPPGLSPERWRAALAQPSAAGGMAGHRQRNAGVGPDGAAAMAPTTTLAVSSRLPNMAGQAASGIGGASGRRPTRFGIRRLRLSHRQWHRPRARRHRDRAAASAASSTAIPCSLRGAQGHRRRARRRPEQSRAQAPPQQLRRHRRVYQPYDVGSPERAGPRSERFNQVIYGGGSTNTTPQRPHPAEDRELDMAGIGKASGDEAAAGGQDAGGTGAGTAAPEGQQDDGDQANVSPEEQAAYDEFVTNGMKLIYQGDHVAPAVLDQLKGKWEGVEDRSARFPQEEKPLDPGTRSTTFRWRRSASCLRSKRARQTRAEARSGCDVPRRRRAHGAAGGHRPGGEYPRLLGGRDDGRREPCGAALRRQLQVDGQAGGARRVRPLPEDAGRPARPVARRRGSAGRRGRAGRAAAGAEQEEQ
jgi:hypothetical protein